MRSEDQVKRKTIAGLKEEGYEVLEKNLGKNRGTDLVFAKSNTTLVIEAEGNRKPDGTALKTDQKYTHLLRAVDQLLLRVPKYGETASYALALPRDPYYVKKTIEMKIGLKRLGVGIYWVEESGEVVSESA